MNKFTLSVVPEIVSQNAVCFCTLQRLNTCTRMLHISRKLFFSSFLNGTLSIPYGNQAYIVSNENTNVNDQLGGMWKEAFEVCFKICPSCNVHTGCRVHLASYLVGTWVPSSEVTRPGHETNHPPLSCAKRKSGATPLLLHTFALHGAQLSIFTLSVVALPKC